MPYHDAHDEALVAAHRKFWPHWLALLLAGALALWFVGMSIHYARADTPEKWKAEVSVTLKDGRSITLTYGNKEEGPHWFDSEAACKQFIADQKSEFSLNLKKVREFAKSRGDTVEKPICVMVLDGA